jgi:hypothetical protein
MAHRHDVQLLMSLVWWSPSAKSIIGDTIQIDGEAIVQTSKIFKSGKWIVGTIGYSAIKPILKEILRDCTDVMDLYSSQLLKTHCNGDCIIACPDESRVWSLTSDDGKILITPHDPSKLYVIGWGKLTIQTLYHIGYADIDAAKVVAELVTNVRRPFEIIDRKGNLRVLLS